MASAPPQPANLICPPCDCAAQGAVVQPPAASPPSTTAEPLVLVGQPPQQPDSDATMVTAPTGGDGWTMFHGSAGRAGVSPAPHVIRPRIRWKARVGIQGWLNAPLVVGRHVIVPSSGNTHNQSDPRDGVFALELASGRVAWQAHFDQDANGAAVVGDRVIATSDDGHVYGLDLGTGAVAWKQRGQGKMYTTPVVVGDLVVTGDAQGYVRAYQWRDGSPRWNVQMNGAIRGGAASDGRFIYVVSQGGEAAAFGLDGRPAWRTTVKRPAFGNGAPVPIEGYPAPVVSNQLLFVPFARDTYYDRPALVALDTRTGRPRWSAPSSGSDQWGNIRTTPVLLDGALIYPEAYSGDVVSIDATNGSTRWRRTVGKCLFPSYASPAAAGDVVYVPRFDGVLYAVRSNDGQVLWRAYLGDATTAAVMPGPGGAPGKDCGWEPASGAPLVSPVGIAPDGTILAGNASDTLFAIEETR